MQPFPLIQLRPESATIIASPVPSAMDLTLGCATKRLKEEAKAAAAETPSKDKKDSKVAEVQPAGGKKKPKDKESLRTETSARPPAAIDQNVSLLLLPFRLRLPIVGKLAARLGSPKLFLPEIVDRMVEALLNKLTMEKFDSISDQIRSWADKSEKEDGQSLIQDTRLVSERGS
jgi:hypothetical protein